LPFRIRKSKNKLFGLLLVITLVSVLLLSEGIFIKETSALTTVLPGSSDSATSLASSSSSLLAIDKSEFAENASSTLVSVKLSTSQSPDVLIALITVYGGNTSVQPSIHDKQFSLQWKERNHDANLAYHAQFFEYWAIAPSTLFLDRIAATISGNVSAIAAIGEKVFAISGANTTFPFDSKTAPSPSQSRQPNTSPEVTVTTTNSNDMILGMGYVGGSPNVTSGSGFTFVGNGKDGSFPETFAEYQVVSNVQTGLLVSASLGNNQDWIMFGDAVVATTLPPSSTSISCSPATVGVGSQTSCTATVSGSSPTGTVSWTSTGSGTFSSTLCTLSSGSCSVNYTPSSTSQTTIMASYSGDANNAGSSNSYSLTVNAATSSTTVSCSPSSIGVGSSSTCTATVSGDSPTGTVSFTSTDSGAKFSASSCTLSSSGSCSVNYTPSAAGSATITASYSGDSNNTQSSGTTTTSQFAVPPTSTTSTTTTRNTTASSSTQKSGGGSSFSFSSTTLIAAIVAIVIVIGAVFASLYIRRRPAK
jgi:hypothetical protein